MKNETLKKNRSLFAEYVYSQVETTLESEKLDYSNTNDYTNLEEYDKMLPFYLKFIEDDNNDNFTIGDKQKLISYINVFLKIDIDKAEDLQEIYDKHFKLITKPKSKKDGNNSNKRKNK